MLDERYAPPQAPLRDATRDPSLLPRPWQVRLAAGLIILTWLLDLPAAYHLTQEDGDWALPAGVEAAVFIILFGLAWALYRGQRWARWAYLGLCVVMYGLSLLGDEDAYPQPTYIDVLDFLSSAAALTALALLFVGPGARWFRAPRD